MAVSPPGGVAGRWVVGAVLAVLILSAATLVVRSGGDGDDLVAVATRRDLVVTLVEAGVLRPVEALTYRSPLAGREAEVVFLARDGSYVEEGDLLVRLETVELVRELEQALDLQRQSEVAVVVAEAEREDALAELESITGGARALDVEEARAQLRLTEKQVERLRAEHAGMEPLVARGFLTREDLDRTALELEQAEVDLDLLRRRVALLADTERPREEQRARLTLAQREAQLVNSRQQITDAARLVASLRQAIEACTLTARRAGLVVVEPNLASSPRRKIRAGDRVTASQGLITIPEVDRMLVETSVRESDLWRVEIGQRVTVSVDAYPDLQLDGAVESIGTLGQPGSGQAFDEKRFTLTIALDGGPRSLRPEMTARARIVVAERPQVVAVPSAALSRDEAGWFVTVLRGARRARQAVTPGESDGLFVEITDGLEEGDRVSLTGPLPRADGSGRVP